MQAERKLSQASMQVYWGAARAFLRWAAREGHIAPEIADHVHPPSSGARLPPALPHPGVVAALERSAFEWSSARLRDRAATLLFLHAGLTVQEALALTWENIDGITARLRISGCAGQERIVP